jgi:hypothetical protein
MVKARKKKAELTGGASLSAGGEKLGTGSVIPRGGPWALSGTGPKRCPGSVSIFISPLLLFFSVFLILSYLLQMTSKQGQTTF